MVHPSAARGRTKFFSSLKLWILREIRARFPSVVWTSIWAVAIVGILRLFKWAAMPIVAAGRRPMRQSSRKHRHLPRAEISSEPIKLAEEHELGPLWHQDGRRKWEWLHDGQEANGWIELGSEGQLRSSFGSGSWEKSEDRLIITFGRCHHVVELLQNVEVPTFKVVKRKMKDNSRTRERESKTLGRLVITTAS